MGISDDGDQFYLSSDKESFRNDEQVGHAPNLTNRDRAKTNPSAIYSVDITARILAGLEPCARTKWAVSASK